MQNLSILFLDMTIKVTLLMLIACVAAAIMRRGSAALRHRLWCLAFCGCLAVPVLCAVMPQWRIPILPAIEPQGVVDNQSESLPSAAQPLTVEPRLAAAARFTTEPGVPDPMESASLYPSPAFPPSMDAAPPTTVAASPVTLPLIDPGNEPESETSPAIPHYGVVWLIGFLLCLLPVVVGAVGSCLQTRGGRLIVDGPWIELGERARAELSIRRNVRIVESSQNCVPMTLGVFRPIVIVPASSDVWSNQRRHVVLLHEMAHIKRLDLPFQLIARVACACYWFHPITWFALHRLRIEREQACDDCVVATGQRATDYASELVNIAQTHTVPTLSVAIGMARSSKLEHRLTALFDRARSHMPLSTPGARLLFAAVLLLVIGIVAVRPVERTAMAQSDSPNARPSGENDLGDRVPDTPGQAPSPAGESQDEASKTASAIAATSKVVGKIAGSDGQPIHGANVAVVIWSHLTDTHGRAAPPVEVWADAQTDDHGDFTVEYPSPANAQHYVQRAYQIALLASAPKQGQGWQFLDFDAQQATVHLQLSEESIRRGRLVDLEGLPVQNATISVTRVGTPAPKQAFAMTRGEGKQGWASDDVFMTKVPASNDAPNHPQGRDLWEEEVRFRSTPRGLACWPSSITTDADGRFTVRGIGKQASVMLHLHGNRQAGAQRFHFASGETAEKVLACDTPRWIEGKVVDADGRPVVGAPVRVVPTGATMYTPTLGVVADWKGRQGHASTAYIMPSPPPYFMDDTVTGITDRNGQFEISPIKNSLGPQRYAVIVRSPPDRSLMPSRQTIVWPKKTTFTQALDFELTPGVRVSGRVIDAESKQPIARARIDFWSQSLPYPTDYVEQMAWETSPDGTIHPSWRKTDYQGHFDVIVPTGQSHLFVNRGSEDNLLDSIRASDVGVPDDAPIPPANWSFLNAPGDRDGKPLHYYPDRLVSLDYDADRESDEIEIALRPAPILNIQVRNPDQSIPQTVRYFGAQFPFRERADGQLSRLKHQGEQKYAMPQRLPDKPIGVAFVDEENSRGVWAELEDPAPIQLTLQPYVSATARLVDVGGKPIDDHRPVLVMSLSSSPETGPGDLERLARDARIDNDIQSWRILTAYDVIWHSVISHGAKGLRTDADGRIRFTKLIAGGHYRLLKFDGTTHDFVAPREDNIDLGDIVVVVPDFDIAYPNEKQLSNSLAGGQAVYNPPPPTAIQQAGTAIQQAGTAIQQAGSVLQSLSAMVGKMAPVPENAKRIVTGKISGDDDAPIHGAHVTVIGISMKYRRGSLDPVAEVLGETTTSTDGAYQIDLSDFSDETHQQVHLVASGPGFGVRGALLNLVETKIDASLNLPPEQLIQGRLVDLEGQPASHIKMTVGTVVGRVKTGWPTGGIGFPDTKTQTKAWPSSITTDAKGHFVIRNIGDDSGVFVKTEGNDRFSPQTLALNTGMSEQRGERDATYRAIVRNTAAGKMAVIPLAPAQIFEGVIRYEDTKRPAANARVSIWASQQERGGSMSSVEGFTDQDGKYRIIVHPGVRFGVQAYAPADQPYLNRRIHDIAWKDEAGAKRIDVDLPRGVLVRGRVSNSETNEPVVQATVQYQPEEANNDFTDDDIIHGWQAIRETNERGEFSIGVLPGPGTLLVNDVQRRFVPQVTSSGVLRRGKPGGSRNYSHAIERLQPDPGSDAIELTLKLQPGATIEGRMVDPDGNPIEKANVVSTLNTFATSLTWTGWPVTAHHGKFEVTGVADDHTTPVHLLDAKNRLGATFMADAKDPHPTVILQPCGQAKARILNQAGKPAEGFAASINIVLNEGVSQYDYESMREGKIAADGDNNANIDRLNYGTRRLTDADGYITFPALIPGAKYRIVDFVDGGVMIVKEFVAESGATTDLGDVKMKIDR